MSKFGNFCKSALKVIFFVLVFIVLLLPVMDVLKFKQHDGTLPMRNYYDLPEDTVDVLFLGSSHVGVNVSPNILWDEYGIAAYNCWGAIQPVWNTYYYLKECLKTQKPKVIVVDVLGAVVSYGDYPDYQYQIKNLLGMRPSREKIEAVLASAPKEQWGNFILELPTFHTRYNELTKEDFEYMPWDHHTDRPTIINEVSETVYPQSIRSTKNVPQAEPLTEKQEKYLRALIELCREESIPLELISSPYEASDMELGRFLTIEELVSEYDGLRFTNFNDCYQDYGIDPQHDYYDPGHFNTFGMPKYAKAIGQMLKDSYDLPDRRLDPDHIWYTSPETETMVESELPENQVVLDNSQTELVYSLPYLFRGDGFEKFVNTGMNLFSDPDASWTLFSRIDSAVENGDRVYFSDFWESDGHMQGLLVRKVDEDHVEILYGKLLDVIAEFPDDGILKIVVVKNGKEFSVYANNEKIVDCVSSPTDAFDQDLTVGCEINDEDNIFRLSGTTVYNLEVFSGVLPDETILNWTPADLPEEPAPEPSPVDFVLENGFAGDGKMRYLDTGIQLYDVSDKSWHLHLVLDNFDNASGAALSCFAEDPNNYRGLLVRQIDAETYGITVGQEYISVSIESRRVVFDIVKDKNHYKVYVNGELKAEKDSKIRYWDGPLFVCAERLLNGEPFRFSTEKVRSLEISSILPSESDIVEKYLSENDVNYIRK